MRRGETGEFGAQHLLNLLFDNDLLGLIQLEVSEGNLSLATVAPRL